MFSDILYFGSFLQASDFIYSNKHSVMNTNLFSEHVKLSQLKQQIRLLLKQVKHCSEGFKLLSKSSLSDFMLLLIQS